jgi:hypothetical protein
MEMREDVLKRWTFPFVPDVRCKRNIPPLFLMWAIKSKEDEPGKKKKEEKIKGDKNNTQEKEFEAVAIYPSDTQLKSLTKSASTFSSSLLRSYQSGEKTHSHQYMMSLHPSQSTHMLSSSLFFSDISTQNIASQSLVSVASPIPYSPGFELLRSGSGVVSPQLSSPAPSSCSPSSSSSSSSSSGLIDYSSNQVLSPPPPDIEPLAFNSTSPDVFLKRYIPYPEHSFGNYVEMRQWLFITRDGLNVQKYFFLCY